MVEACTTPKLVLHVSYIIFSMLVQRVCMYTYKKLEWQCSNVLWRPVQLLYNNETCPACYLYNKECTGPKCMFVHIQQGRVAGIYCIVAVCTATVLNRNLYCMLVTPYRAYYSKEYINIHTPR